MDQIEKAAEVGYQMQEATRRCRVDDLKTALEESKNLTPEQQQRNLYSSSSGYLPLIAIEKGRLDVLKAFLEAGIDLMEPFEPHQKLLVLEAIHRRQKDIVLFFAKDLKVDFSMPLQSGSYNIPINNVIHYMPETLEVIWPLIEGWVHGMQGIEGHTAPISSAVISENVETVEFLLSKGLSLDIELTDGGSLAHYASTTEMARLLYDHDVDFAARNSHGQTPVEQFESFCLQQKSGFSDYDKMFAAYLDALAKKNVLLANGVLSNYREAQAAKAAANFLEPGSGVA